ncbi:hypothetical protein [Paraburkholderia sp. WSM4174]|uniref:hypothetical protein n=1 Tax=Paraburkholderia sp. WSM4174 TaxID=2991071 RepID=UPI003D1A2BA4
MNLEGAYGMALSLTVFMAGTLDQATADSLLERAKGICPYLDATRIHAFGQDHRRRAGLLDDRQPRAGFDSGAAGHAGTAAGSLSGQACTRRAFNSSAIARSSAASGWCSSGKFDNAQDVLLNASAALSRVSVAASASASSAGSGGSNLTCAATSRCGNASNARRARSTRVAALLPVCSSS